MKITKDIFCYRLGFYGAVYSVGMTQNEIDIAWNAYCELDPSCTDAEMEIAIAKCSDDIIACGASVKE